MSKIIITIITLSVFLFGIEVPSNHIVTTDWLEKNIGNKKLVIIDTRKVSDYEKSHIVGSVNYPKKSYFQGSLGTVPKLPSTPNQMEELLQNAGVTKDSIIAFYSAGINNKDFADSASGIWNLWLYGIQNTVFVDGGFAKWINEGKITTKELPSITRSDIEIESFDKSIVASLDDITEAMYDDDLQITDARVVKFYIGNDDRKDLVRHGRIPTSKLTPMIRYTKNSGKYFELITKDEAIKTITNNGYGIELDNPLIIYCNTGHKARGLWFVSKFLIGMENVKVYDGGVVEYSRSKMPMEDGESMD